MVVVVVVVDVLVVVVVGGVVGAMTNEVPFTRLTDIFEMGVEAQLLNGPN